MEQHPNEKGIIHSHTYKIANYLKYNIKDKKLKKRILTHTSENRDEVLKQHMNSKEPTVLISPSMTEGVDLKGDLSRFQILCKVPYPSWVIQLLRRECISSKAGIVYKQQKQLYNLLDEVLETRKIQLLHTF